jgi:excisionase family DNA binding protein
MSAYARTEGQLRAVPIVQGVKHVGVGSEELIAGLLAQVAKFVAAAVVARLEAPCGSDAEWLDSRHAAEYLGVHRDTLRKLAAERAIPSEQDGPGCKLFFRRSDLDAWRAGGGGPRHLAAVAERTA